MTSLAAQELIEDARSWFSQIDRTMLGSFAFDVEYLILRHALSNIMTIGIDPVKQELQSLGYAWLQDFRASGKAQGLGNVELRFKARSEICFWWLVSDDDDLAKRAGGHAVYVDPLWVNRYKALFAVPERLPYFEAGIFDVVTVDKYIDAGIDLSLVSALEV